MVSELLQDRPRLVKQMGSIIFILVYKWIFKFPLGYLRYHQRSTHNTRPAKTKFHESFCPRKVLSFLRLSADAARNCGKTFGAHEGWPEAAHPWQPCRDGPRLHSSGSPSGSPAAAEGSWGVCCAPQPRRALSNAERAVAAAAIFEPQGSCDCVLSSLFL